MKFTILSHAAMLVEHQGRAIVTDPWLIGSCYWRSWWNYPEPGRELLAHLHADYVYLSHLHWDHYHGPSLRKFFSNDTTFLLPKVCTTRMVEDLRGMGFTRIVEIPHGGEYPLGEDFTLSSYQFGIGVDSAAVFKGGGVCILDANDCKLFGLPCRHLLRLHGRPDFVLRSHSSASPIPYCIATHDQEFADFRTREDYIEEFSRFAISVGARYAIPFASNHCFLHKETLRYNATAVTPDEVEGYCNRLAQEVGADTRCVVMSPGSQWSDSAGFQLVAFDYQRRDEYVQQLAHKHQGTLESYYREEESELADFASFQAYFGPFLKALPWVVRRRWRVPVLFRTADSQKTHHWLVEPNVPRVRAVEEVVAGAIIIDVPTRVLNDCCKLRMFSTWAASKRLSITLPVRDALGTLNLFFLLLDAYELDHIPLRRNFSPRSLSVLARRWREAVEAAGLLVKHKLWRRPFRIRDLYPLPVGQKSQRDHRPDPVCYAAAAAVDLPGQPAASSGPAPHGSDWVSVAKVSELPAGRGAQVRWGEHTLALFHVDDDFYALADRCAHQGAPLWSGPISDRAVTCTRHGARFSLSTGEALCGPATRGVACYAVRVQGDEVQVNLSLSFRNDDTRRLRHGN